MSNTTFNQSSYNSHQSTFIYSYILSFKHYLSSSELSNTSSLPTSQTKAFPKLQSHIQAGTAVKYSCYRKACYIKIPIYSNNSTYQGMSFFFSLFFINTHAYLYIHTHRSLPLLQMLLNAGFFGKMCHIHDVPSY